MISEEILQPMNLLLRKFFIKHPDVTQIKVAEQLEVSDRIVRYWLSGQKDARKSHKRLLSQYDKDLSAKQKTTALIP